MSAAISSCQDVCEELFPLVLFLDEHGCIATLSERMGNIVGRDCIGSDFFTAFTVITPSFDQAERTQIFSGSAKHIILFHLPNNQYAFRGQVVYGEFDGEIRYAILCTPWVSWMRENCAKRQLEISDFPVLDNQLDLEMSFTTQALMQKDLEKLADYLREAKEKAEESSRAKSEFVDHVSHELRTPLNAIVAAAELLEGMLDDPNEERLLSIMQKSTGTLTEMINNILDFSRIGKMQYLSEVTSFNLRELVQDTQTVFIAQAEKQECRLQCSFSEELPEQVEADSLGLKKILINLIGNSLKHSGSDLITTTVQFTPGEGRSGFIDISVEDFGAGMSKEDQAQLFEEFISGNKSGLGSSGLGMAIVRKLIENAGGEVRVESEVGRGTCFIVRYPVTVEESDTALIDCHKTDERMSADNVESLSGVALLVDDNEMNLEVGKLLLEKHGLIVKLARSGEEAVKLCKLLHLDIVYMDINMPGIDGVEATRLIHSDKDSEDLPVVALTANVSKEKVTRYFEQGMSGVLLKPLDMSRVVEVSLPLLNGRPHKHLAPKYFVGKSQSSHNPLLDADVLVTLLDDIGRDNADRVVDLFRAESRKTIDDLLNSLEESRYGSAQSSAHKLASSALTYGFTRIGIRLREIENMHVDYLQQERESIRCELSKLYDESLDELSGSMARLCESQSQSLTA